MTRYAVTMADVPWSYKDKLRQDEGKKRSAADQYDVMTLEQICRYPFEALAPCSCGATAKRLATEETGEPVCEAGCNGLRPDVTIADAWADDALLAFWVTNPMLLDGSAATVVRRWGFESKQLVTWVKGELQAKATDDPGSLWNLGDSVASVKVTNRGLTMAAWLSLQIGMGFYTRGCTEHLVLATRGKATKLVKDKGLPNVIVEAPRAHSQKPEAAYRLLERLAGGPYLELFARTRRAGWDQLGNQLEAQA